MSIGEGTGLDFATIRGRDYPTIRQFTVFLENRVGQLLEVVRRFEGSKVRIVALSINDATECAFVRFLLSHPEQGREILERADNEAYGEQHVHGCRKGKAVLQVNEQEE